MNPCFLLILALLIGKDLISKDALIHFTKLYDEMLHDYVKQGKRDGIQLQLIHYGAWEKDSKHPKALAILSKANLKNLSVIEKIAHWSNIYNFLTIDLIIKNKEKQSIKNLGNSLKSPWQSYHWEINNQSYSLDQIEHNILRKLGEPRIHIAIVCAAISCPDIRVEPYNPKMLEFQLKEQTAIFLKNTKKGMHWDDKLQTITISKIFEWFQDDFKKTGLIPFLKKASGQKINTIKKKKYFDYNWNLNGYW